MAECGRKALSLLEAARSRYESLQISDDVFGESGDDSSDNPFYSTSGDSDSDNYIAEVGEEEQPQPQQQQQQQQNHLQKRGDKESGGHRGGLGGGGSGNSGAGPPGALTRSQAEEEGWTGTLQDVTVPPFKDTYGETRCNMNEVISSRGTPVCVCVYVRVCVWLDGERVQFTFMLFRVRQGLSASVSGAKSTQKAIALRQLDTCFMFVCVCVCVCVCVHPSE